jgi:putative Holliday junction resolvase
MPDPDGDGSGWRRGVRLCLDWGRARVGVAACDPEGLLAYPVETITNDAGVFERVEELVEEHGPIELVLGLPTDLRGKAGPAARAMFVVAARLNQQIAVPVRLVDERMTTAVAGRGLAAAGQSGRERRAVIDQAAAVAILQQALDMERRTGLPAGRLATSGEET